MTQEQQVLDIIKQLIIRSLVGSELNKVYVHLNKPIIRPLVLALVLFCLSSIQARAQIEQLSQVNKLPPPSKTSKTQPSRKTYKAKAEKSKTDKITTAVLWQAPPYRQMVSKLSPEEELLRDMQILDLLLKAAENKIPQLAKAQKILAKNKSPQDNKIMLGQTILQEINSQTKALDLSSISRARNKHEAQALIHKISQYLYLNYKIYKVKFFINDMRNPQFNQKIEEAQRNLIYITSDTTLKQIDQIFLHTKQQEELAHVF